jgi:hypothetical protein
LVALENNDLTVAADEFRKASQLAPGNALVHYYLAVVLSKQDKPSDGLQSLKRAMQLGLPEKESTAAEDLEAKLTYSLKRQENLDVSWLKGMWGVSSRREGRLPASACVDTSYREWKLTLSADGDILRGTLTYSLNQSSVHAVSPLYDKGCRSHNYSWLDTWDAVIKRGDSPGKANADFKYVGCNGDCGENGNHWNSWQTVIEKRSDDQIFVNGAENGTQSAFSILSRLK